MSNKNISRTTRQSPSAIETPRAKRVPLCEPGTAHRTGSCYGEDEVVTLSPWPRQCTQCGEDEPLPGAEVHFVVVHFESMMAGRNISYTLNLTIKQNKSTWNAQVWRVWDGWHQSGASIWPWYEWYLHIMHQFDSIGFILVHHRSKSNLRWHTLSLHHGAI